MKREYDLKKLQKRPGKVKVDPEAKKVPINIRIDGSVLAQLKSGAEKIGIPYQTYVSSILHQFVNGELIERKTVKMLKALKAV